MSRPEARTCAVCGDVADSVTDHTIHVTTAHPDLNRTTSTARRVAGEASPAARPVSCWRCAALIPADTRLCPSCGWEHPGFQAFGNRDRPPLVSADVADLDHRGRPR